MPDPLYSPRFTQAFVITPSATGGQLATPDGSNGRPIPYCSSFVTDTSGTVTVIAKESNTPVTIPVIAGIVVRLAIKQLTSVSTSMTVTGFL